MADFSALKTSIQNYIKQNGNEEITGNLLQQILLSMVSTLGDSAINDLVTALNAEIANRGNADTTLQGNIDNEATARGNADTELGDRITTLQGVVNGIVANVENGYVYAGIATPSATPVSGKVFYLALTAGTYTNFGAAVVPQGINILKYNGSAWSLDSFLGLDDAPTQGSSNLVKSGGVLDSIIKDGSAFDLSAYNNGTTYADLSAALTALNALPAAYKKGGMSFKFVLTSDNNYVQWRLMSDTFNTTVTNWQGVDNEPTADSNNLVKSGGILKTIIKTAGVKVDVHQGSIDGNNGNIIPSAIWSTYTDLQHSKQELFINVSSLGLLNYMIFGIAYYTDETGSTFSSFETIQKDSAKVTANKYFRVMITQNPLSTSENIEVQNVLLLLTNISDLTNSVNTLCEEQFRTSGKDIAKSAEWTDGNNHFSIHNYVNWKQGTIIKAEAKVDVQKINLTPYKWALVALGTDGAQIVLGSELAYNEILTFTLTKDVKDIYLQIHKSSWKENVTIKFDLSAQGEIDFIKDVISEKDTLTLNQGSINGNNGVITDGTEWGLYTDKIYENGVLSVERLSTNEICIAGAGFYKKDDDSFVSFDNVQTQWKAIYELDNIDPDTYARVLLVAKYTSSLIPITPSEVILTKETSIREKVNEIDERVTILENAEKTVSICLSDIYAVIGDTVQIFFNSIIDGYNEDMILKVVCAYGRAYNNYWECTPTTAGTTTFALSVLNKDGNVIATKTVNLIIKAATNATKNILCVGDSLMMDGEAPIELSRRLKGTTGVATSPAALNLTNFNVVGRKTNQGDTVGWEGTGGWTWYNYINGTGNPGARFYVTDADNVHIGDIYGINGFTQRFQVIEKNVTSGSGNVLLGFYGRGDIYNDHSLLPSTGTLYLVSGYGQNSITFNNSVIESFQPFWNKNTDSFDIESYVDEYCSGKVDYLFVLLGINTLIGTNPYNSAAINGIANQAKQFIDLVHAQLPNTIILLGTTLMISQLGGVGTGYFTSSIDGQYNIKAFNHKTIELNKAYMELAQMDNYKDFVKIVDCSAQFDAFYGYPLMEKPYNIRVPERKELISANTVHPMGMIGGQKWEEGIWMVADAIFRAVIGLSA